MHSREELSREFRALGVNIGDVVMVHASVRSVGPLAGGPDQIHLALKDALSNQGTLFMYTGAPDYFDDVGRGVYTAAQEAEILEKLPPYDAHTARSARNNGILVEFLRTYPDTRVNPHIARFAAWGSQVDYLFSQQPWDFAFGKDSVLERFVELDGTILLIGCDHDQVTFLHYAEHIVDIPDKRVVTFQVPVLEHGKRVWRAMREVDSSKGAHANWPDRFFALIVDGFTRREGIRGSRVGDARCYLLPARGLLDFALPIMRAVAADPRAADHLLTASGAAE